MSRSRRPRIPFTHLLLVAALGVIAALGTAGRASAATDTVNSVQFRSASSTDLGDLTATMNSTAAVTGLTAQLWTTGATPADAFDATLTSTGATTNPDGTYSATWDMTTPITTAQLPAGTYSITAVATFTDGTTQTVRNAGQFAFVNQPTITMTADHTDVGYDYSPVVNLTGHVTLRTPDGTTIPDANDAVRLTSLDNVSLGSAVTNQNGDFTAQVRISIPNDGLEALVGETATEGTAFTVIPFTEVIDPVKLGNVHLAAQTVNYGTPDTILGTLSYLPKDTGTSYLPLPGRRVKVFSSEYPGKVAATGLTNASGQFSVKLPTWNIVGSSWTVVAGGTAGDLFFGPASTGNVPMKVRVRTAITSFHVSLSQYWQLSYSGCLNLPSRIPAAAIPTTANLVFQYSSGGANGPWHNLRWRPPVTRTCGNDGVWFSGTATAPRNLASYRVYYHGTTVNGTIHLAAGSARVIAWKYADRIVNFSASPHVVARNGKLTVRGQLEYYARSRWHVYGGQVVYVIFRQQGTSTWYWITRVRTNSTGHFTATVRDSVGSATWSAEFEGNSTHLATGPSGVYVRVTG